jgi:hypothetical protein
MQTAGYLKSRDFVTEILKRVESDPASARRYFPMKQHSISLNMLIDRTFRFRAHLVTATTYRDMLENFMALQV